MRKKIIYKLKFKKKASCYLTIFSLCFLVNSFNLNKSIATQIDNNLTNNVNDRLIDIFINQFIEKNNIKNSDDEDIFNYDKFVNDEISNNDDNVSFTNQLLFKMFYLIKKNKNNFLINIEETFKNIQNLPEEIKNKLVKKSKFDQLKQTTIKLYDNLENVFNNILHKLNIKNDDISEIYDTLITKTFLSPSIYSKAIVSCFKIYLYICNVVEYFVNLEIKISSQKNKINIVPLNFTKNIVSFKYYFFSLFLAIIKKNYNSSSLNTSKLLNSIFPVEFNLKNKLTPNFNIIFSKNKPLKLKNIELNIRLQNSLDYVNYLAQCLNQVRHCINAIIPLSQYFKNSNYDIFNLYETNVKFAFDIESLKLCLTNFFYMFNYNKFNKNFNIPDLNTIKTKVLNIQPDKIDDYLVNMLNNLKIDSKNFEIHSFFENTYIKYFNICLQNIIDDKIQIYDELNSNISKVFNYVDANKLKQIKRRLILFNAVNIAYVVFNHLVKQNFINFKIPHSSNQLAAKVNFQNAIEFQKMAHLKFFNTDDKNLNNDLLKKYEYKIKNMLNRSYIYLNINYITNNYFFAKKTLTESIFIDQTSKFINSLCNYYLKMVLNNSSLKNNLIKNVLSDIINSDSNDNSNFNNFNDFNNIEKPVNTFIGKKTKK